MNTPDTNNPDTNNPDTNDTRTVSRRQLVKTGTLSAGVLVTLALLLIVNYLGWKYHHRFDWTKSRFYTLSDKSENVLKPWETWGKGFIKSDAWLDLLYKEITNR